MHRPRRIASLLFALAILGSGCAGLPESHDFSLSVTQVLPTEATLLETSAALTLRLVNEGVAPVTLVGGSHRLYLNDTYVGRAVSSERITVPQLGTITQTVTVHLENLALMRKVTELSRADSPRIAYRLESQLHAELPVQRRLRTVTRGELDLGELMAGAPPDKSV